MRCGLNCCLCREAEQQLAAWRAEASASSSEAPELLRQLAADRAQAEEQQAHLTSELQALRQQLLQVQQAAAKAGGAAKADSSAVLHAQKQLLLQEKQHKAEVRADVIWALLGVTLASFYILPAGSLCKSDKFTWVPKQHHQAVCGRG